MECVWPKVSGPWHLKGWVDSILEVAQKILSIMPGFAH